jgi:hypothetical protein
MINVPGCQLNNKQTWQKWLAEMGSKALYFKNSGKSGACYYQGMMNAVGNLIPPAASFQGQ